MINIGGYYGGKSLLTPSLLSLVPKSFDRYIEPFCGFASLGLNVSARQKILADANPGTIESLRAIRDRPDAVIYYLKNIDWSQSTFKAIKPIVETATEGTALGEQSIAYSAMAYQRGGAMSGFSDEQCKRAAKRNWTYLNDVSEHLQGVSLFCCRFDRLFPKRGERKDLYPLTSISNRDFLYLDPPYLKGGEHYICQMSLDEQVQMLEWASYSPAKIMISGYESNLYDQHLSGDRWSKVKLNAQSNKRQPKVDIVWTNY